MFIVLYLIVIDIVTVIVIDIYSAIVIDIYSARLTVIEILLQFKMNLN